MRAFERGDRIGVPASARLCKAERDQHLQVRLGLLRGRREEGDGVGCGAALGEIRAQERLGLRVLRRERVRAPQRCDRGIELTAVALNLRERHPGGPHVRPLLNQSLRDAKRAAFLPRRVQPNRLLQGRIERDEPLGVVVHGVAARRGHARRHVPETFETGARVRGLGDARRGGR